MSARIGQWSFNRLNRTSLPRPSSNGWKKATGRTWGRTNTLSSLVKFKKTESFTLETSATFRSPEKTDLNSCHKLHTGLHSIINRIKLTACCLSLRKEVYKSVRRLFVTFPFRSPSTWRVETYSILLQTRIEQVLDVEWQKMTSARVRRPNRQSNLPQPWCQPLRIPAVMIQLKTLQWRSQENSTSWYH